MMDDIEKKLQDKLRFAGEKIPSIKRRSNINDLISKSYDMLPRLTAYLHDNPRRLAIRREHPDLFRMHRKTELCGLQFTSMGNRFLLEWPERQLVEMSREARRGLFRDLCER
ncbi:MAG: hypothetical protein J6T05_06410 [Prevotella sp.]|nr:hypothetical protein [Prevotella sp.]